VISTVDRKVSIQTNRELGDDATITFVELADAHDPAFIESLSRYMRAAASPSAVHAYEQMNGQIDTRPILPSIQAPTRVMNRTGDPCANVEAARDMASRIPGAKFLALRLDS
jgi:pimeloyl-ACP methyl ester carboxylesterase